MADNDKTPGLIGTLGRSFIQGVHDWSSARLGVTEGKANRAAPAQQILTGKGMPVPTPSDFRSEKTIAKHDAPLTTAIARLSDAILKPPLQLFEKVEKDGEETLERADDHACIQLLNSPLPANAKITAANVKQGWVQSLMRSGNAYNSLEEIAGGLPGEIWPLEPHRIKATLESKGTVAKYEYDAGGKQIPYKPEEIVHIKFFDIDSPTYGASKTTSILNEILTNRFGKRWNMNFFKQGAIPPGILSPKHDLETEDQKRLKQDWQEQHGGIDNAHKIAVMPFEFDFKALSPTLTDMAFTELLAFNRETIFGVHGLPPLYAGILKFANFANSKSQEKLFWMIAAMPLFTIIEDALNHQLLWQYYDPEKNYILKFNYDNIEPLQVDRKEKMAVDVGYVRAAVRPINEVRADHGWPPVEWGDEKPTSAFYGDKGNPDEPPPEPEPAKWAFPDEFKDIYADDPAEGMRCKKFHWRYDKLLTSAENGMKRIIQTYFRKQSRRTVKSFQEYTKGLQSRLYWIVKAARRDNETSAVFNLKEENTYLRKEIKGFYKATIKRSGEEATRDIAPKKSIGLGGGFDIHDPETLALIDKLMNRIEYINDKTWSDLQSVLSAGYEQGDSLDTISENIRKMFRDMSEYRSERIARTEMTGVTNAGSHQAYRQAGVQKVKWLAYFDSRTRKTHVDAHIASAENPVDIMAGEKFQVGGSLMSYPGDPDGSASETCNCRCTTIAIIEEVL